MEKKEKEKESLEQMFGQLETVIEAMEKEEVSLEDSFELYNRGMTLLSRCSRAIDEVEKKVLVLDENGETHEFNEEYREKKEYIENVLRAYLPEKEGYQKVIMERWSTASWQEASAAPCADAGDIPPFRWKGQGDRAVPRGHRDDPYLFPCP